MLRFDLHVHSKYSYDSLMEPSGIVKEAKKKGLKGIAVTDHNTIKGAIEAAGYAGEDFFVIVGSEISTPEAEILGLFLKEDVPPGPSKEVIKKIRDQGGLAVLAHPYKRRSEISPALLRELDGIEVFNSRGERSFFSSCNKKALALAEEYGMAGTAGSDAHFLSEIGRGGIEIENADGIDAVRDRIKAGGCATYGRTAPLFAEFSSQSVRAAKLRNPLIFIKALLRIVYAPFAGFFKIGDGYR